MALTGSGQISFNDVRTEISQSTTTNYSFYGWAGGEYNYLNGSAQNYAPINLLSTGSEFCRKYSLFLSSGGPSSVNYNYLDCGGAPVSSSINSGTTVYFNAKSGSVNHAPPVTVLTDSGSTLRFSESSPLNTPLSMSAWYSYDHTSYIGLNTTASLYHHSIYNCYPSSMIVIDAGTSNTTMSINISGSAVDPYGLGCWVLFYGKPWTSNATNGSTIPGCGCVNAGNAVLIDSGSATVNVNKVITYNYTYNSATGSKLYLVLYGDPCYSP
jgi:hypothetical protein